MVFILVGATVLIVAVMTIRFLTKGQISMKLRYGLWLLVALRLMLPVRFGDNPYSAVSILRKAAEPFVLAQEAGGRRHPVQRAPGQKTWRRQAVYQRKRDRT